MLSAEDDVTYVCNEFYIEMLDNKEMLLSRVSFMLEEDHTWAV